MIPPGVHLNLDEAAYHADPALGSSDLIKILGPGGPADWWWERPENPLWTPPEPNAKTEEGKLLGSTIHTRVLEGVASFEARYTTIPKGLIGKVDEIKAWCRERGAVPDRSLTSSKWKLADWEDWAREHDAPLLCDWVESDARQIIKPAWLPVIEMIGDEVDKHMGWLMEGGLSEVSVFWTNDEGVRLKCRIDRVCPGVLLDLKSFSTFKGGRTPEEALARTIDRYSYHVQAGHYLDGGERAVAFVEAGDVHLHPVAGVWSPEDALDRLKALVVKPFTKWMWLFAKTLSAPMIYPLAIEDVSKDDAILAGRREAARAAATYAAWKAKFGDAPWLAPVVVRPAWTPWMFEERDPVLPDAEDEDGDDDEKTDDV